MDWARAIERNSEALKDIVAALFAMLGLGGSDMAARIPQPLHRAVLRLLRPAESAMRRLIVIAARGLVVKAAPSRPMPVEPIIGKGGNHVPRFSSSIRARISQARTAVHSPGLPRVSISSETIPGWRQCGQLPGPRTIPFRRLMALWVPCASAAGSRPSSWRWMICRARPGASPAGG